MKQFLVFLFLLGGSRLSADFTPTQTLTVTPTSTFTVTASPTVTLSYTPPPASSTITVSPSPTVTATFTVVPFPPDQIKKHGMATLIKQYGLWWFQNHDPSFRRKK